MSLVLNLPAADGTLSAYHLSGEPTARPDAPPSFSRIAYAAAHVVSNPLRAEVARADFCFSHSSGGTSARPAGPHSSDPDS